MSKNLIFTCVYSIFLFLSSCTQTVTMVHTQGQATDVVDETSDTSPNVSADIDVPVSALPSS